jgi:hypothetical protein
MGCWCALVVGAPWSASAIQGLVGHDVTLQVLDFVQAKRAPATLAKVSQSKVDCHEQSGPMNSAMPLLVCLCSVLLQS